MSLDWQINLDLGAVADRTLAARPRAIHGALEHIAEVSAAQTPVEFGTLVGSQRVTPESEIVDSGSISYHTDYAIYVHEILRNEHPHGNAKFLEGPMLTEAETAKKIMAREIGQAI